MALLKQVAIISAILLVGLFAEESSPPAHFYLTTRTTDLRIVEPTLASISEIDPQLSLKLIVHGWTESANASHYITMERALLRQASYNVIRVDYSEIASRNYFLAAASIGSVGTFVADFLLKLIQDVGFSHDDVHIIGHSLGAHVSGLVGRRVEELSGQKVHRISGLDPAGPLFQYNFDWFKLTKHDAKIVDILHTDAGKLGYAGVEGTVDFFPNGGTGCQPGCYDDQAFSDIDKISDMFYCSHHKSYLYYSASILMEINATKCHSWLDYTNGLCHGNEMILFGFKMPDNAHGNYYLKIEMDNNFVENELLQ